MGGKYEHLECDTKSMLFSPIVCREVMTAGEMPALLWEFDGRYESMSSAAVNGGVQSIDWLLNVRVPSDYSRCDLDAHAAEIVNDLGLSGFGSTLFTAADVRKVQHASINGVVVDSTVGVTKPTWASDVSSGWGDWQPGTINIVAQMPVALTLSAAVNAIITITEAKTQSLFQHGVPGTGTASDSVVVCWPSSSHREQFCGPRSQWGSLLAQATFQSIDKGLLVHPRKSASS